jgi:hypothetical protein
MLKRSSTWSAVKYAWLKAEQGTKAVWMPSYFLQNPNCFEAFTESVQRTWNNYIHLAEFKSGLLP